MRSATLGMGTLQILLSAGLIAGYLLLFALQFTTAVVLGCGLALSSTAIGLQYLQERGELASPHGQAATRQKRRLFLRIGGPAPVSRPCRSASPCCVRWRM